MAYRTNGGINASLLIAATLAAIFIGLAANPANATQTLTFTASDFLANGDPLDSSLTIVKETGVVTQSDIKNYDVQIVDPVGTFSFTPANSTLTVTGSPLTEEGDLLYFNFDLNGSSMVFQSDSADDTLTLEGPLAGSFTTGYLGFASLDNDINTSAALTGNLPIAFSNGVVSGAVPEPTTWAMMLIGFGGIGAAMRFERRQSRTVAA